MKDIYYFIGFLTIAYHIYNFLYYDYIEEMNNTFLKLEFKNNIDEIIPGLKILFNSILPFLTSLLWLLLSLFTFNWLIFLVRFIIISTYYALFENDKRDKIFSRIFSVINIIVITFAIYNTYYLKIELLDYCLTLI